MSRIDGLMAEFCPSGVTFKAIGELAECYSGATPASGVAAYWEGGAIPWMSSGEVNKKIIYGTDKKITKVGFDSCSTKMVPSNAIVIALAGQGKTRGMVARTRIPLCTNQSLCSIVINDEAVESDFLYYYLSTQYQQLRSASSGDDTRGGLNLQIIRGYRVPVPPIEVQREIVRVLNTFTELEMQLEAELEARWQQYRFYRDALLNFGDRMNSAGNQPKLVELGEIGSFVRGTGIQKSDFTERGVGCIHYGQIHTHYGTWADKTMSFVSPAFAVRLRKAHKGDLVIATTSEDDQAVAKAVAWLGDEEVAVSTDAYIFRHMLNPKYVSYFFQTGFFQSQKKPYITGTKVRRISGKSLAKIRIPVPPREEQERIVAILDKFDALVNDRSGGLPAEIKARRQQYEYYRNRLLSFREAA